MIVRNNTAHSLQFTNSFASAIKKPRDNKCGSSKRVNACDKTPRLSNKNRKILRLLGYVKKRARI